MRRPSPAVLARTELHGRYWHWSSLTRPSARAIGPAQSHRARAVSVPSTRGIGLPRPSTIPRCRRCALRTPRRCQESAPPRRAPPGTSSTAPAPVQPARSSQRHWVQYSISRRGARFIARRAAHPPMRLQRGDDLPMVRKAMLDVLREDLPPVDDDVEGTAASRRSRRFEPELPGDGGRQTGGLGPIVSTDAVLDGDLHGRSYRSTGAGGWARGLGPG